MPQIRWSIDRRYTAVGVVLVVIGIVCNQAVLTRVFSPDGRLSNSSTLAIWIFDACMITWGLLLPRVAAARHLLFTLVPTFVLYLVLETLSITTGILVPVDQVDRYHWYHEFLIPDARLGFRPRPNLRDFTLSWMRGRLTEKVNTDALGFRNRDGDYQAARTYFIGDSITWGSWVPRERTFYGRIQTSVGTPVISWAAGGYSMLHYGILFEDLALRHRPDTVFLCIAANDLNPLPTIDQVSDGFAHARAYYHPISWYDRSILSRVIYLLGEGRWPFGQQRVRSRRASNGLWLYPERGASPTYLVRGYREVEGAVGDIASSANRRGIRLVVVLIPSKESVYDAEYRRLFAENARYLDNERVGFTRLCEVATRHLTPCIDLTGPLRTLAGTKVLYFDTDPHWNEDGHAAAASVLLRALK